MPQDFDLEEIQLHLLKLGKAIDSGQPAVDLLALVAETLDVLRKKQAKAS